MRTSNNLENKTPSEPIQAHSSLEPLLQYNQHQKPFMNQGLLWPFWPLSKLQKKISSFRLVLEGKTSKETSRSLNLEFLEKLLANNFALSDAEDNTSRLFNRECTADLCLLRTLLAISLKSQSQLSWKWWTVSLSAYENLAASRTLLQQLLACLFFNWDSLHARLNSHYEAWS